ncbi:lipoyl protein ligase domain-containing protein [Novosphingobium malaysiense]|uniref:BPL/LPL catalytic domain-containing protein n=1 Tax=Novosphingobium malaysiense TaxID=1348853 RepID=A0A0B1ZLR2_9SPHN|nr:lipoate--protein ligase family protein [Novosphingobium malaysiense]KHK90220.1 hypothetical protein LK12_16320 [Novosphingobium malaysiense]
MPAAIDPQPHRAFSDTFLASIASVCPNAMFDLELRDGKVADEERLLTRLLANGQETEAVRVWNDRRQLVTSRRLAKRSGFDQAAAAMAALGWPVAVRPSGGTTVVHRPGVINISVIHVSRSLPDHRQGFDRLCEIMVEAARPMGIELSVGRLANAYCEGSHDIGWQCRKVAGTSALYRHKSGFHGCLYHASLVLYGNCAADVDAISRFERWLGLPAQYQAADHASLFDAYSQLGDCRPDHSTRLLPFL